MRKPGFGLSDLPSAFTYTEARRRGVSDRRLYALRDAGVLEPIGRGLYRRADLPDGTDPDLIEIGRRASRATLCLTTALARHQLTDLIPPSIDVAVPRGHSRPRVQAPVIWHTFAPATFDIGREDVAVSDTVRIGLYDPQRCIIDAFRLRHWEGPEIAYEALRRWLRRRDAQPSQLLKVARSFPKAEPALRAALEILL